MSRDALIVGISSYEVLNSLQTPADDTEAVAQLLTQYGEFNVTRLPGVIDKTTNLLRVGRKTKVTQRQLKEALVQLLKPTGKHLPDTALFYFSGHGTRENLGLPQGFLATSDTHPEADHWGLSLKWLRELLQDSPGVFTEALLQALDPTRHPEGLITNLTLVDLISRSLKRTVQRPLHTNVGSPILLTRRHPEHSVPLPTTPSEVCPYKGLLYFDCNDEDPLYFFGREKLTDQLLENDAVPLSPHPTNSIYL